MRYIIKVLFILMAYTIGMSSCKNNNAGDTHNKEDQHESDTGTSAPGKEIVMLTHRQQKAIGLEIGKLEYRNLDVSVKITGKLEIPPQHKAEVSPFIGGNVRQINFIEGDHVKKGQILALLEHPDYIDLQQNFLEVESSLEYLKEEYKRKKTLFDQEVSSAKDYQKALSDFKSATAQYNGLISKIKLLGLNPDDISAGHISPAIAIRTPITGNINAVNINIGEYAAPQTTLFNISNNNHVHADFMVYEKDIYKVKIGQLIHFTVSNIPNKILQAKVFSIGQNFENDPRAIHVHADIITPDVKLLTGMYVNGRLQVHNTKVKSLPQSAIVSEGEKRYIFIQNKNPNLGFSQKDSATAFKMVEVSTGITDQGYTEIRLLTDLPDSAAIVTRGAYYLQADLTKEENEHSH